MTSNHKTIPEEAVAEKARKKRRKRRKKFWTKKRKRQAVSVLAPLLVLGAVWLGHDLLNSIEAKEYKLPQSGVIGIDISHYQGNIDWNDLRFNYLLTTRELIRQESSYYKNVNFIVAKATEGLTMRDSRYNEYRKGAAAKGIPFGAYHYFRPGVSSSQQAQNFISAAGLRSGDIVPILDVEEHRRLSVSKLREGVLGWLQAVEKHYGCTPVIYCNIHYYNKYFNHEKFRKYPKWIAAYSRSGLNMDYVFWQQTDKGIVGGIDGYVDIDVFNGTALEFKNYLIK